MHEAPPLTGSGAYTRPQRRHLPRVAAPLPATVAPMPRSRGAYGRGNRRQMRRLLALFCWATGVRSATSGVMLRTVHHLMDDARRALQVSQNGLAEKLGVSRRTGQRWSKGSGPVGTDLHKMALLVHPVDPSLAAEIASAGGTSLEALGVLGGVPGPVLPPPQALIAAPDRVVDAVVCAAAEAMQVTP